MIDCEQRCNNLLTDMQNTDYAKPGSRACHRPAAKVRAVIPCLEWCWCHCFFGISRAQDDSSDGKGVE